MGDDNRCTVRWRGVDAGELVDAWPDMWYLEGTWQPASSEAGAKFTNAATPLNANDVLADPTRGLLVELAYDDGATTHALVLTLVDGRLLVRRVFDRELVKWLLENVE